MNYRKITAVYFSPCGNTRRMVCMLADNLKRILEIPVLEDSFTLPGERLEERYFAPDELVIFGTPTYAGRVPNKIAPEIRRLFHGRGTPAVPVVTFGNRSYDNSLAELSSILQANAFSVIGAAAMCMPHVFSSSLGSSHPDAGDLELLEKLSVHAAACLQNRSGEKELQIPGDPEAPYYTPLGTDGRPAKFLKAVPRCRTDLCRHCGTCAKVCPMGSVSQEDPSAMTGICVKCQACVHSCPARARYFDDPAFLSHVAMLEKSYMRDTQSEIFYCP